MSTSANHRIEEIHAMLASGHRGVRMDRHSLMLWGLAAAFLVLTTELIFTDERFPMEWQQIVAANSYIAVILLSIGFVDYRMTRALRARSDETVPFVQRQLTKVWWMLIALIVVINIGMNFFGGGYLFFGIAIAMMGIALYIQGLFSQQMLSWGGVLLIAIGLAVVALHPPYPLQKYLTASVFGIGLPLMAMIINRVNSNQSLGSKILLSGGWLFLVVSPALLAHQLLGGQATPDVPLVSLQEYQQKPITGQAAVRLPAGTTVPVRVHITGDIIEGAVDAVIPLHLANRLDLLLDNGRPQGLFRVDDGEWKRKVYNYRIRDYRLESRITDEAGPQVNLSFRISTNN